MPFRRDISLQCGMVRQGSFSRVVDVRKRLYWELVGIRLLIIEPF